jgi:hypothetical protein
MQSDKRIINRLTIAPAGKEFERHVRPCYKVGSMSNGPLESECANRLYRSRVSTRRFRARSGFPKRLYKARRLIRLDQRCSGLTGRKASAHQALKQWFSSQSKIVFDNLTVKADSSRVYLKGGDCAISGRVLFQEKSDSPLRRTNAGAVSTPVRMYGTF